jgi:hypothetical protein
MDAVGAGAGGGGGGGGGVAFLPHAPSVIKAPRARINKNHLVLSCFTFIPPYDPKARPRAQRSVFTISNSNSVANYDQ